MQRTSGLGPLILLLALTSPVALAACAGDSSSTEVAPSADPAPDVVESVATDSCDPEGLEPPTA